MKQQNTKASNLRQNNQDAKYIKITNFHFKRVAMAIKMRFLSILLNIVEFSIKPGAIALIRTPFGNPEATDLTKDNMAPFEAAYIGHV